MESARHPHQPEDRPRQPPAEGEERQDEDEIVPAEDGFAQFMQLGDAAAARQVESTPDTPSASGPSAPSAPSPPSPLTFLSGLFNKATTTLETTIQSASQELQTATAGLSNVSSDALTQATTVGSHALETVSDLVADLARPSSKTPQLPSSTTLLKSFITASPILLHTRTIGGAQVSVTATGMYKHPSREEFSFHITWSDDGQHAINTPAPPEGRVRRKPVLALCGVNIGNDQLVMVHEDGALRMYSLEHETFAILKQSGAADDFVPSLIAYTSGRIILAAGEIVRVVDNRLNVLNVIQPPEICRCVVGGVERFSTVSYVGDAVGYEDGAVKMENGSAFVAMGGGVGGVLSFYDNALLVCCGGDLDASITAFDAMTGRCFVRRMMPYVPTGIWKVSGYDNSICPSENAFIVGGIGGEVEIFRVVVVSTERVEIRLVRRISERVRGKKSVEGVLYAKEEGVLSAWGKTEVRRWQLGALDAGALNLRPREGGVNEENVQKVLEEDLGGGDMGVGGVLRAQNVLAMILDEGGIEESVKDYLVVEFQKRQADMLMRVGQADTELRRAARRIKGTFGKGMEGEGGNELEKRLRRQVKRCAAFEVEFAVRRHHERVSEVRTDTLAKLKELLVDSLKGRERVQSIREEAERLTTRIE